LDYILRRACYISASKIKKKRIISLPVFDDFNSMQE